MSNLFKHTPKFATALAALAAGCATSFEVTDVCPAGEQFRRSVATVETPAPGYPPPDAFQEALLGVMENAPLEDGRRDLLVLSGGGQFGAYGAGVLQSFIAEQRGGAKFALVTGVSTGALQATAAFLGDADSLAAMVEGYDIDAETDLALPKRTFFGLPTEAALYSLAPARAVFDRFLTDERLAAVGAADGDERKLYVGVVDVKDGQFYAFDLTAIAASNLPKAEKRACYIEAVFASAAVPVIYEPVVIDGRQYFDGGVRSSVFLDRAAASMAILGRDGAERSTLYVLFNNYFMIPEREAFAISPLSALNRTRQIAFDQIDRASLAALRYYADRYDIRWTTLPADACQAENANRVGEVFDPAFMRCLIGRGRADGVREDLFRPL